MCERGFARQHRPQPLLVLRRQAIEEIEIEHGTVERNEAATDGDGLMQGSEIAEPDERTGIAANRFVIDAIEDAHRAISAAREEERIEFIRVEKSVELCDALVVIAGEIATELMGDVRGKRYACSLRFEMALRFVDALELGRRRD